MNPALGPNPPLDALALHLFARRRPGRHNRRPGRHKFITDVVEGVETEVGFRFEAECGGWGYGGISSGTW